jgi:hypothetical protein
MAEVHPPRITPSGYQQKSSLWLLVVLTLLAASIRLYRLDHVPLRGDEAFAVRVWAQPPAETWSELAGWEPHPIGTFVLFWAWKSLAGESEFAMRMLPLLVNLPGVAVIMVLGKRVVGTGAAIWMLGLLWAVNPFQVWHAQDVRNYALWSGLSPLAFWLFLRALEHNRRNDWLLYGLAEIAALYIFLLEPFFLLVQAIYLLLFYRQRLRAAAITWAGIGLAAIPWIIQLIRLAGSDYQGTAAKVSLDTLITTFIPTLLFGEGKLSLVAGAGLLLVLVFGLAAGGQRRLKQRVLLGLWLFLPLILLMIAGTRLSVFLPRYVIPITPPLLMTILWVAYRAGGRARRFPIMPTFAVLVIGIVSLISLYAYFYTDPPKAPDWRNFGRFLNSRAEAGDLIVIGNSDPAFRYYYRGDASEAPPSEITDPATVLENYRGIFVQVSDETADLSRYLQEQAQFIPPATSLLKQYRTYGVDPAEIEFPLDLTFGDVAHLRGYTLLGGDEVGITVLLYWEPLRQTETEMVGYVHAHRPDEPTPLELDDHVPLHGDASTIAWIPDSLYRDPFFLSLPVGGYDLMIGMYAAESLQPLMIVDGDGQVLGDSYPLSQITIR